MSLYGEIAALSAALCWAINSYLYSLAGRQVGSLAVTHVRLWIAIALLAVTHLLVYHTLIPDGLSQSGFLYLSVSGLIGYVFGDIMLFEALVLIGPQLAMLMMTLAPIFSALIGWGVLHETLSSLEILAIGLTLTGIGWVVTEKRDHTHEQKRQYGLGIIMGGLGAVGQSVGLLFSRLGMQDGVSPLSANLIRVSVSALFMLLIMALRGKAIPQFVAMKNRTACRQIVIGSFFGPYLGVMLALYSINHATLGVASTLMQLVPIFLIPITYFLMKERISLRTLMGTLIAIGGAAMFFGI
ncbi:MAG: DMT family transporter [Candidatus Delongbacteria bacterium]|nr:DMT family transporter [Candidatus Delongbacteria bacterium]